MKPRKYKHTSGYQHRKEDLERLKRQYEQQIETVRARYEKILDALLKTKE